jgi:hypothetical protein
LAAFGGITGGCSGVVVVEVLCTIYSTEANPELLLEEKVDCRLRMSFEGLVEVLLNLSCLFSARH